MPIYHPSLVQRFVNFPPEQQLLMIGNELNRATNQHERPDYYHKHLVLAMELMDLCIRDPKWQLKLRELLRARELMGKYYLSGSQNLQQFTDNLIKLSPQAYRLLKMRPPSKTQ